MAKERRSLTDTTVPENQTNTLQTTAERTPVRRTFPTYWLIAKNENGRVEVLVDALAGSEEEALLVFSHEEEADLFLSLSEAGDDGWRARESTAGELVSVLYGPCAGAKGVVLDPLPEMVAQRTLGLVSLSRECFMDLVLSTALTRGHQLMNKIW
jgi:hypothetical protein